MITRIGEFSGLAGIRLCWQSWYPDDKIPLAVVVVMHGGNNYCDMDSIRGFAESLVKAGYCVYSYDQRGFGRSEGIRMHMGKWENVRGDLAAFLHFVRIHEANRKIYAFGISFGALQVLDLAAVLPCLLDGVIVASVSTHPLPLPALVRVITSFVGRFFPKAKMPAQPHESFSGAKEIMRGTNLWADPLCPATSTFGNLRELCARQKQIAKELKFISIPILHMQGGQDTIALPDNTLADKTASVDTSYHFYPDSEHDMLAGTDSMQIIADIVKWLNERTA